MKKRAVIILGAGAPLAWGGPSTWAITDELLKDTEYQTKKGLNLAQYICESLSNFYKNSPSDIHFEYIINALETISEYLNDVLSQGGPPQFTGSKPVWFLLNKQVEEMENFLYTITSDGLGSLHNLSKPGDSPTYSIPIGTERRHYIFKVIEHYLQIIRNCIGSYDYEDALNKFNRQNQELSEFYSFLKKQDYIIRFYTTNYDDLVPNILNLTSKQQLFRGFEQDSNGRYFPQINRILQDRDTDCYYNLHGSIYWEIDTNQYFEPSFLYSPGSQRITPMAHGEYTNPSERTIIYNIITGFNKLQKVSVEPLRSFFNCLSNDCITADLISTIGYSYGDTHINRSISYGINHGNSKFLHITKSENFFGSAEYINMQQNTLKKKRHGADFIADHSWINAKDGSASVYTNGFNDFLINQEWKKISHLI